MSEFKVIPDKYNNGVYIKEYTGNVKEYIISDKIQDKIITGIDKFAFSEHRELVSITFPKSIEYIGAHAFYNCRSLKQITLYDGVFDIGDGAFKNCPDISLINMQRCTDNTKCIKGILSEVNNEIELTINYDDGKAKLIFPYYLYNYEENTPARIVNQITEGSGIRYRECIEGKDINYAEYDKIFDAAMYIDVLDASWKIAVLRLKYPYRLSDAARKRYTEFLSDNRIRLVVQLAGMEKYDMLKDILEMDLLSRTDLSNCIDEVRKSSYMEGLGILLEYQRQKYGAERKKFEF